MKPPKPQNPKERNTTQTTTTDRFSLQKHAYFKVYGDPKKDMNLKSMAIFWNYILPKRVVQTFSLQRYLS